MFATAARGRQDNLCWLSPAITVDGQSGVRPRSVDALPFLRKLVALSAPVAQLDRASDYGSEGLKFESSRVRIFAGPGRNLVLSPLARGTKVVRFCPMKPVLASILLSLLASCASKEDNPPPDPAKARAEAKARDDFAKTLPKPVDR